MGKKTVPNHQPGKLSSLKFETVLKKQDQPDHEEQAAILQGKYTPKTAKPRIKHAKSIHVPLESAETHGRSPCTNPQSKRSWSSKILSMAPYQ